MDFYIAYLFIKSAIPSFFIQLLLIFQLQIHVTITDIIVFRLTRQILSFF